MKKTVLFIIAVTAFFTSCVRMEGIFDGSDTAAIAPIYLMGKGPLASLVYPIPLIEKAIVKAEECNTNPYSEDSFAFIINDDSFLKESELELKEYPDFGEWPEIDFSHYSLVVGRVLCANGGYGVVDQRIKKTMSGMKLYVKVEATSILHQAHPQHAFFCALFPKLKGGEVEVVRWDNY